jgi:hypothetical protein
MQGSQIQLQMSVSTMPKVYCYLMNQNKRVSGESCVQRLHTECRVKK